MRLISGDCIEAMRELPDESVDAIVTDPPYGLGFMGKAWDDLPPGQEWGRACLRVLKPGGHLLAFGGSRTYHRLACAVEDAGFEVRDQMMWLYGSGFPKSLDVSKAIDRRRYNREQILDVTRWVRQARDAAGVSNSDIDAAFGFAGMAGHWTSVKSQPAVPTLDQVPTLLRVLKVEQQDVPSEVVRLLFDLNGVAGEPGNNWLNREVVGSKRSTQLAVAPGQGHERPQKDLDLTAPATPEAEAWNGWGTALKPAHEPIVVARKPLAGTVAENVQRFGTGALNIDGCRIGIAPGDEPSAGHRTATFGTQETVSGGDGSGGWQAAEGRWPANVVLDEEAGRLLDEQSGESEDGVAVRTNGISDAGMFGFGNREPEADVGYGGSGGASRFFYCAKASKGERNAGLDGFEEKDGGAYANGTGMPGRTFRDGEWVQTGSWDEPNRKSCANHHPTVKPISLMRYLVRLVTPPEGTVLDPFLGSGTTGIAAVLEGFDFIGIEREAEYLAIAQARIEWWEKHRGDGATEEILKAAGVRDEIEAGGQLGLLDEAA